MYKGYEDASGKAVLIKVLTQEAANDPTLVDWFEHEASSVEAINHPNVVALHKAGREETGRPYLVTEFVEGASLEEVIAQLGPLPPELVAFVGAEVASGLAAAHEAGILHRDLNPANILLGADGAVKLADFGLATRIITGDNGLSSEVRGTLGFLSPEAVLGNEVGPAADMFALGATLLEALSGHKAFPASDTRQALDSALNHDPIPSLRADPRVPEKLTTSIQKLLESKPADRTTAEETVVILTESAIVPGPEGNRVGREMLSTFLDDPAKYQALRPAFDPAPRSTNVNKEFTAAGGEVGRGSLRHRIPRLAFVGVMVLVAVAVAAFVLLELRNPAASSEALLNTDVPDSMVVDLPEGIVDASPPTLTSEEDPNSQTEQLPLAGGMSTPVPTPQTSQETGPNSEPESRVASEPDSPNQESQPTARPGQLTVVVQPWAEVFVDGQKVGEGSGVEIPQLTAGTHIVVLRNPQFPDVRNSVQIRPGGQERLAVSLWAHVARITLQVHPWANVELDGRSIGVVPPEREVILWPGSHTVALSHPQLGTWSGTIQVTAGERRTVPLNLSRLLGDTSG